MIETLRNTMKATSLNVQHFDGQKDEWIIVKMVENAVSAYVFCGEWSLKPPFASAWIVLTVSAAEKRVNL